MSRRLSREVLERLYWAEGRSLREIAALEHTSASVILEQMKGYDMPRRKPGNGGKRPDRETLHRLYVVERMSIEACAEICECSTATIRRAMADYEMEARAPTDYPRRRTGVGYSYASTSAIPRMRIVPRGKK